MTTKKMNPEISDATVKSEITNGLDDLLEQAQANENAGQAEDKKAAEKIERQEVDTLQKDLSDTLDMLASMAEPALYFLSPEQFEQYWGKRVRVAIAGSGAEIMRRHGLSMGDMMNQYGPYIALAGALVPSALATVAAYKSEKKKQIASSSGGNDGSNQTG